MPQQLEVIASLANIEHGNDNNTVLATIGQQIDGFYVYKLIPEPGECYASVNWRGLLTDSASIAGIASLLWQIYTTQVATAPPPEEITIPNKSGEIVRIERKPSLFIQFKTEDGRFEQFNIGGNYDSKDTFVKEFTEKVEKLRSTGNCTDLIENFERSDKWLRIK